MGMVTGQTINIVQIEGQMFVRQPLTLLMTIKTEVATGLFQHPLIGSAMCFVTGATLPAGKRLVADFVVGPGVLMAL